MKALLCIGRLLRLELVEKSSEKEATIRPKNKWLAWDGKNLHICTVNGQTTAKLPSSVVAKHSKFHNRAPQGKPFTAECPSSLGKLQFLGLIKALVYTVPKKVDSPNKNPYQWHHNFGDTGHRGGEYPKSVMPALMKDSRGNIFIKRRKGNIYTVDEWLRG